MHKFVHSCFCFFAFFLNYFTTKKRDDWLSFVEVLSFILSFLLSLSLKSWLLAIPFRGISYCSVVSNSTSFFSFFFFRV